MVGQGGEPGKSILSPWCPGKAERALLRQGPRPMSRKQAAPGPPRGWPGGRGGVRRQSEASEPQRAVISG